MKTLRAVGTALVCVLSLFGVTALRAGGQIPKAAWKRPIGLPLANSGKAKPENYYMIDDGYWQGAPVGGFGAGTFSRSYRGDFVRWHLKTGVHKYQTVFANQFSVYEKEEGSPKSVAQVLCACKPSGPALSSWNWSYPVGAGDYYALYPKSWYDYSAKQLPVHLVLEQFSPILPDNYRETSYPVAVYQWHAANPNPRPVTVSILFSWTNMVGWSRGFSHNFKDQINMGNINRFESQDVTWGGRPAQMKGIVFDHLRSGPVTQDWDGQFVIAGLETPGVKISYLTSFIPDTDGREVWEPFAKSGVLPDNNLNWESAGEPLAGAIAVTFTLKPGEKKTIPMVLAWDFPVVQFGGGRKWWRRYTNFFGTSGTNGWAIAGTGLRNAAHWSAAIDQWQAPYINNESLPLWFRGELFNELYVLADNGTIWARPFGSPPATPDSFSYLECFDYSYYSTLDVLFYGSMPLVKFWPDIDKGLLREFASTVPEQNAQKMLWQWKSQQNQAYVFRERKRRGALPHDLGTPEEDPLFDPNQYGWQDVNRWKDLNSKFVLMVYRDYVLTGAKDTAFLQQTWPAVQLAMQYLRQFDRTGDGLPQNGGFPDQTYDVWIARGDSAYCGSLYLAALRASEEMARQLGHPHEAQKYHALFLQGQKSFISKLWNGEYFRYDDGSVYRDIIMADQLAGQWYADLTGLGSIVPRSMRLSALHKIYEFNVMKFGGGEMGAVNGMTPDGKLPSSNEQAHEVWTGTTFGVASFMLAEGMRKEAFHTARGIYHVVYEKDGYWFRTPEAWDEDGNFRASMYMRPGAIWAMEMVNPPAGQPSQARAVKAAGPRAKKRGNLSLVSAK